MSFKEFFLRALILFFFLCNSAFSEGMFSSNNNTKSFLSSDEAFQVSLEKDSSSYLLINFKISDGYYLYKDKIKIYLNDKEIFDIAFPKSKIKEDEFFGKSEVYEDSFFIKIHNKDRINSLNVIYQGCADKGLCYPPVKKDLFLNSVSKINNTYLKKVSEPEKIYGKLLLNNIFTNIILFIGFGLLLSFTPCVLPMVPILSSLILRFDKNNFNKPFLLSLNYVFGLCTVYLFVGLFVGYSVDLYNVQSVFQDPFYLTIFSLILVILAFSMFGFFEIKILNSFQQWVSNLSNRYNVGGYRGSYIMGFLSSLIVGPCVAAPLAGMFIYITSENPGFIITGLLFLSMGVGMSIPLLIYGTFFGKFVPKSGKWMKYINYLIGILLLFVALTFVDRLVPIFDFNNQESSLSFKKVNNLVEFKKFLVLKSDKITLLDVYADWCIECKLMEQKTFKDKNIEKYLKNFRLVKIDVTSNNKEDKELLKHLNIIGPPAYKFFDKDGEEIEGFGIQGYMSSEEFLIHLEELDKY